MGKRRKYSAEVREHAVRLVVESESHHESQWAAITSVAGKIGCTAETLRQWVRHKPNVTRASAPPTAAN
jgi:transposase